MRATIALCVTTLCALPCCGGSEAAGGTADAGGGSSGTGPGGSAGSGASGGNAGSGASAGSGGGAGTGGMAGAAGNAGAAGSGVAGSGGSTGGGTGSGGSAGTPDGGAGTSGAGGGGTCNACVSPALSWGNDGGRIAQRDSSALDCTTYRHVRDYFSTPQTPTRCEQPLTCSGQSGISVQSVAMALAHADVTGAFARAPVLYGRDMRPVDGQVLIVTQGGRSVSIGSDCGAPGSGACQPIPAGVAALASLLRTLDQEQLAKEPCASVF